MCAVVCTAKIIKLNLNVKSTNPYNVCPNVAVPDTSSGDHRGLSTNGEGGSTLKSSPPPQPKTISLARTEVFATVLFTEFLKELAAIAQEHSILSYMPMEEWCSLTERGIALVGSVWKCFPTTTTKVFPALVGEDDISLVIIFSLSLEVFLIYMDKYCMNTVYIMDFFYLKENLLWKMIVSFWHKEGCMRKHCSKYWMSHVICEWRTMTYLQSALGKPCTGQWHWDGSFGLIS